MKDMKDWSIEDQNAARIIAARINEENFLKNYSQKEEYGSITALSFLSKFILIVGIISSIIIFFTMCIEKHHTLWGTEEISFNYFWLAISISTLLSSIVMWAVLNALNTITINSEKNK